MAKKIKWRGAPAMEYASSGGSIPGITGSESVQRNFFLHQLYEWQSGQGYRNTLSDLETMFSNFPVPHNGFTNEDSRIKANVTTRSGSSGSLTFPTSNTYVKSINYEPPKAILRKTYTSGDGSIPNDRHYMRYLIVGGGGGGGKGTSPWAGTGVGGAGGGGGCIAYGEVRIGGYLVGGYEYQVGQGGAGATAHGNRGVTGGTSSISSSVQSRSISAYGGQGGGNETLSGSGGQFGNTVSGTDEYEYGRTRHLSGNYIYGKKGGRNRAAGVARNVTSQTTRNTIGLGDLIDGGDGFGWYNRITSSSYLGTSAPGGAGVDEKGGPGGGGASLGRGGTYKSNKTWTTPGIGGGGGGGGQPTKGIDGQDGGNGVIYLFW